MESNIERNAESEEKYLTWNDIRENDFLLGRGKDHVGNVRFREEFIEVNRAKYQKACKTKEKNSIANEILQEWKKSGGRFLEQDHFRSSLSSSSMWQLAHDDTVLQKIKQKLRERCCAKKSVQKKEKYTENFEKEIAECFDDATDIMIDTDDSDNENDKNTKNMNDIVSWNDIQENDFLLGKGLFIQDHVGNVHFREEFINVNRARYQETRKTKEKQAIANQILHEWRKCGGRFLGQQDGNDSPENSLWRDVGDEDMLKRIRQKLCEKPRPNKNKNNNNMDTADTNIVVNPQNDGGSSNLPPFIDFRHDESSVVIQKDPPHELQLMGNIPWNEIGENDFLLGKGGFIQVHVGNIRFRKLINANKSRCDATVRVRGKKAIANEILREWRNRGGRFLERQGEDLEPRDSLWRDVGDEVMLTRVRQKLRERQGNKNNSALYNYDQTNNGDAIIVANPPRVVAPVFNDGSINEQEVAHVSFSENVNNQRQLGDSGNNDFHEHQDQSNSQRNRNLCGPDTDDGLPSRSGNEPTVRRGRETHSLVFHPQQQTLDLSQDNATNIAADPPPVVDDSAIGNVNQQKAARFPFNHDNINVNEEQTGRRHGDNNMMQERGGGRGTQKQRETCSLSSMDASDLEAVLVDDVSRDGIPASQGHHETITSEDDLDAMKIESVASSDISLSDIEAQLNQELKRHKQGFSAWIPSGLIHHLDTDDFPDI